MFHASLAYEIGQEKKVLNYVPLKLQRSISFVDRFTFLYIDPFSQQFPLRYIASKAGDAHRYAFGLSCAVLSDVEHKGKWIL